MAMTASGGKICLMRKWDINEAVELIGRERLTAAGGVPSMVAELVESKLSKEKNTLESFLFGGAPASNRLPGQAMGVFTTASV